MYIATNVAKPANSAGGGSPKNANVTIIAIKDIATLPARDSKGILIAGNIVLKAGAKAISVYMTASKIKAGYEADGDEDSQTFKHKFEGPHPGNSLAIKEFVQNWSGEPCIIIDSSCSDDFKTIYGTRCAPLYLKPSGKDENDSREHMLVFEAFAKTTHLPAHYTGAIPADTIVGPVPAEDITIDEDTTIVKIMSNEDTDISFDAILAPHDTIISLIGTGGVTPSVLPSGNTNNKAVLVNGTTWVALDGAVIHLKVFKAGALTLLIEQSRA
jgi:hypothetical protein